MRTQSTQLISKAQIAAIKTAQRARGLEDEDYRAMLWSLFRVTSCTQLTQAQAGVVLDRLNGRPTTAPPVRAARPVTGRRHTWRRPARPPWAGPARAITPKQQVYLTGLFATLGWDQTRRDAFCQRVLGTPWPQTNDQVTAVLRVLRPIAIRYRHRGGYDRA